MMKKTITIAILLVTIIACTKDDDKAPTYSEILTEKEWNAISLITYNDENIETDREMISNTEFLFLKNHDVIIYNKTIPENILKWQFIDNETAIKLIPYEEEDEKIWKIETLTTTEFIISKKSNPTAVIQTKEVATFKRNK